MTPSPFLFPLSSTLKRSIGLAGGGMLLFSLSLFGGMPMNGLQLHQMQALNRELGKLCNDPPRRALNVCRLHAQLVRSL